MKRPPVYNKNMGGHFWVKVKTAAQTRQKLYETDGSHMLQKYYLSCL